METSGQKRMTVAKTRHARREAKETAAETAADEAKEKKATVPTGIEEAEEDEMVASIAVIMAKYVL